MTFLVAHFKPASRYCTELMEQLIVTVGEALLKRLDHDYDLPVRESRMECDGPDAADVLDNLYAARALCHARKPNDPPNVRTFCDEQLGHDGNHRHGRSEFWPQAPAASAGRGESSSPEVSDPPTAPSGERGNTTSAGPPAAEDDPAGGDFPPSPAGSPTWVDWAVPAICDVLADHRPKTDDPRTGTGIYCYDTGDGHAPGPHGWFDDWQEWREHVAPLIAERLDTAWRAKQHRGAIETGLDMGASIAASFFPQHSRPTK